MARTMLIAGNWKMNMNRLETAELINALRNKAEHTDQSEVEMAVFPPFTSLETALRELAGSSITLGAQNVHYEQKGAFTGEISVEMLTEAGCRYVLVGHSERRTFLGENDHAVNRKVKICLQKNLLPVLCVGETEDERQTGNTFDVLNRQLLYGLQGIDDLSLERIVIAYEPVWAIGTGLTASGEEAQEVHDFIRRILRNFTSAETADGIRILYGGSMTPATAPGLLSQPDIDGGLVGGASLDSNSFLKIYQVAREMAREKKA